MDLSALRQVMGQMGMNTGILNQNNPQASAHAPVTPQGAPGGLHTQPGMTAAGTGPVGQSLAGSNPPAGMGQQPLQNAGQSQTQLGFPAGDPEAAVILKALSSRLGTLGKLGR